MSLFGALLRLYPRAFRARFEAGMRYAFARDLDAARVRGTFAVIVFWIASVSDLLWHALCERAPGRRYMRSAFTTDWRDAYRSLRSAPIVTAVAILSLALGVGANTTLFTVLNGLSLKSLPVRDADRLALLEPGSWTNRVWEAIRDDPQAYGAGAFAWSAEEFDISPTHTTDIVDGLYASASMFDVLGLRMTRGRPFTALDDQHGGGPAGPVAVISHGFWMSRFGGAGDVIGRMLHVERVPFTIVGVAPKGFFGPDVGRSADILLPLGTELNVSGTDSSLVHPRSWWLNIAVTLRPGETLEEGTTRMRALQPRVRLTAMPPDADTETRDSFLTDPFVLEPAGAGRSPLRGQYAKPLTIILIVVALVLVIACANIASLLLARALSRRRELSLRLALGASRMRIARQFLAESLMIAGTAAGLGLIVANWGGRLLVAQLGTFNSRPHLDLALDWRVLLFTAAVGLGTLLLFGLAPMAGLSGVSPHDAMKDGPRGSARERTLGFRSGLVVLQVALSLAIVVTAGLFTRTYVLLQTRDAGFSRDNVLIVTANLEPTGIPPAARAQAFTRLAEAAAAAPGVSSAVVSYTTPIGGRGWNTRIANPDGSATNARTRVSWVNAVSPGWFDTFGVKLIEGRDVASSDGPGAPRVAIVNRAFAARFLGTAHPVGMSFLELQPRQAPQRFDVIGLVEDSAYRSLRAAMAPSMYVPMQQSEATSTAAVSIRAAGGNPESLTHVIAGVLGREQPRASFSFRSFSDQLNAALTLERLLARLSLFFGMLALMLAGVGIYGVAAYAVSRRRREIGIRMALGADAGRVVRLVVRRLTALVGIGVVLGAGVSLWAARFVSTLLYGLEPRDTATFLSAAAILLAVGLIAGWLPARRAARLDPTIVLRD